MVSILLAAPKVNRTPSRMLFVAARFAQWLPLLTVGQQSGHKGAVSFLLDLLAVSELLGDKGHDSNAYRAALMERDITPVFHQRQTQTSRNIL